MFVLALFLGESILTFAGEQLRERRARRLAVERERTKQAIVAQQRDELIWRQLSRPPPRQLTTPDRPQPLTTAAQWEHTFDRLNAMLLVNQAYRYALDPTPRQTASLWSHCGAARFAYNWGLQLVKQRLDQRAAGLKVEVPWTLPTLRWEWNRAKQQVAPWWRENSKEAYNSGLDALARALRNWSDSKHGRRQGRPVGFPNFKTKHRAQPACRFWTDPIRIEPDRHHVVLPKLGRLRTHESTRKLARRLEAGTVRILNATVTCTADRWYVSFTVEVQREVRVPTQPEAIVGVDVGIYHLAVLSTGQLIPNPRPLDQARHRLRRLHREMARRHGPRAPDGSHRTPSVGWQQTRRRLARAYARAANVRRDSLHKFTSDLAGTYGTIVVEHLNVAGMLRNRHLARAIADTGFGEFRRQLGYKTVWAGTRLVQADPFYPSSKICSGCGTVTAKLLLSARVFCCQHCGSCIDRDLNAAWNLAAFVNEVVAGSGPETRNARGGDGRPGLAGQTSQKREASIAASLPG